ncbi:hypothetical protein MC885_002478, partial [Smutsia gigantea]
MTLSGFSYKGKRCPTCHNMTDKYKLVTDECQKIDPDLTPEEKYSFMVESYATSHSFLIEQALSKLNLKKLWKKPVLYSRKDIKIYLRNFNNTIQLCSYFWVIMVIYYRKVAIKLVFIIQIS